MVIMRKTILKTRRRVPISLKAASLAGFLPGAFSPDNEACPPASRRLGLGTADAQGAPGTAGSSAAPDLPAGCSRASGCYQSETPMGFQEQACGGRTCFLTTYVYTNYLACYINSKQIAVSNLFARSQL